MSSRLLAIVGIIAVLAVAALAADDVRWTLRTHGTNEAMAVTGHSGVGLVGELDSVHVYLPAGLTGTVQVVVHSPMGGPDLVIATNAAIVTYRVFAPRVAATTTAGTNQWVVGATGQRLVLAGESLSATVSGASATNAAIRFRAVILDKQ